MKKLYIFLVLLVTLFTVNAQTNEPIKGPSKEQTINFIKSEIEGKTIGGTCLFGENEYRFTSGREFSDIKLDLIDGKLNVKYAQNFIYKYTEISTAQHVDESIKDYENADIDLDKIESVYISIGRMNSECVKKGNNETIIYLVFKPVPGYETKSTIINNKYFQIPINFYSAPDKDFKSR